MVDIDHSVVYRREDGKRGSGTVVHFSSNFLVLEIYEKQQEIRLNEVFGNVRVSMGQVVFYDGKAIVREVVDSSSIQLVTLYLRDHCIAVGTTDSESENQFALERYFQVYLSEYTLPSEVETNLFHFADYLSQMLMGLRVSRLKLHGGRFNFGISSQDESRIRLQSIDRCLKDLTKRYHQLCLAIRDVNEDQKVQVGDFFKRFVFPLSRGSRVFRYFHSAKRSSYINHQAQQLLKSESGHQVGSLSGYLLDEFFKTCGGFGDVEQRCEHWVGIIHQWLLEHDGTLRILLLGTDMTPADVVSRLSPTELGRVEFDLYCTPTECPKTFQTHLCDLVSNASGIGRLQFFQAPVRILLQWYFQQKKGDFSDYDLIFSGSFLSSLSCKSAAYLMGFCLGLLREGGKLYLFSDQSEYSPIREHWLLWFDHRFELSDWKRYLPFEPIWTQASYDYGRLTVFDSIPRNV